MVEEDRHCIDVLTQIQASEAALQASRRASSTTTRNCMNVDAEEPSLKTDELMGAVGRLVRG